MNQYFKVSKKDKNIIIRNETIGITVKEDLIIDLKIKKTELYKRTSMNKHEVALGLVEGTNLCQPF